MTATTLPVGAPSAAPANHAAAADDDRPFVTIVVPCLNEGLVIGEFVDWCHEGLRRCGRVGEVLIVDSSTDASPAIAEARGARVLRVPKRGLGQAYLDAIPHVRDGYVVMGDADLTYDFRELAPFVDALDAGHEFVMGTRMRGYIEPGAMPPLHRYFGTPLTTWILNRIYGTRYSDIHCGMRGMTLEALKRMRLQSRSWEYASEMVLKAALLGLRTTDVPIRFYKDRPGRQSHHRRSGWLSPWKAGWINLKAMFVYAPEFFLYRPSLVMLAVGLALVLGLSHGPRTVGSVGFDLHWMLFGMTLCTVGYSALHLAVLSKVYHGFDRTAARRALALFAYDRGMLLGASFVAIGVMLNAVLVAHYWVNRLRLAEISYSGVLGLTLIVLGFQTMVHTLILEMVRRPRYDASDPANPAAAAGPPPAVPPHGMEVP
ncbi:MAG: glycosyl transferase family 2, partial [Phycisphaerales bacterium]|nr:glycosyl transferase family 2 [Phycisphaerales bacterium]